MTQAKVSTEQAQQATKQHGTLRGAARSLGVSTGAVTRALNKGKIVDRTRKRGEFVTPPRATDPQRRDQPIDSWTLETIRAARAAQMRGDFKMPVRLAEALRTEACLFTAYHNRLAPHNAVETELRSCGGVRGDAVARRAAQSVQCQRAVLEGMIGTLANHGIAIGKIIREVAEDGGRVDMRLEEWPLEHVKWNPAREVLETRVRDGGSMVTITHGDGTWIVVRKFLVNPWTQEAALLPAAMLWAGVAYAMSDWAQTLKSHGQAKIAAQLPELFALQEAADGGAGAASALTPEAEYTLRTLQDMVSGEAGAGIFAAGTKLDFLANGSSAWQVFKEFVLDRQKSSARIYTGTDATMGSQGGAPGVDIAVLFGVASTIIQGDFRAVEEAVNTGLYQVWTAINEGDSRYAPSLHYLLPDPDSKAKAAEQSEREGMLAAAIKARKDSGMVVDQDVVNALAKKFGVSPAPALASGDVKAVPIPLAPTDIAKIVRVGPALRSVGLELFGDARDQMTITELDEFVKAKSAAGAPPAPAEQKALSRLHTLSKRIALAGTRNFDESKISRDGDGQFGSGPGNPNSGPKPKGGGSEGDGPKGGGGSGEEPTAEKTAAPKDRKAVAEGRLSEAKRGHDLALEAHTEETARYNKARDTLDQKAKVRAAAADEAEKYAAEAKAEIKRVDREYKGVDKEIQAAVAAGELDETDESFDEDPRVQRANELSQHDERLREHYGNLAREAKANRKPDRKLEKARAALEAGDARAFEKAVDAGASSDGDSEVGDPLRDAATDWRARAGYREKGNVDEPDTDHYDTVRERYAASDPLPRAKLDFPSDEMPNPQRTQRRADRAQRAVRLHEREVRRVGGKVDADGDGRTGQAEEKDDKRKAKLSRLILESGAWPKG